MQQVDVVIHDGTLYDGSGNPPVTGDVAIQGDTIVAVGPQTEMWGALELDAGGLAVCPGFINMLSWATESLIADGRSMSDILQGVTLEVMGEGTSMGPLSEAMKREWRAEQGDIHYDIEWTTLGEYLDYLVRRGVSCNVASFAGSSTLRIHEMGYADREPTAGEMERMCKLLRRAMEEGALGLSSALIYTPAVYAKFDEMVTLASVAAEYGGLYISHIRNEGTRLVESVEELIETARQAGVAAEIYHLKASGRANWHRIDDAIRKIEAARAEGLRITADMYTYAASSTGLDAAMPPWVQEGGLHAWIERLQTPDIRERVGIEMSMPGDDWENTYLQAGSPDNVRLVGFKSPALKPLIGKTLGQVAAMRHKTPEDTAMDLVIEDGSRVDCVYFTMSEDNVRKQIALPWVSFGSDGGSLAAEGAFLQSSTHPRAYGNFARLLGKYVRDAKVMPLQEAIRKLTSLPAANLKIDRRGRLAPGYYADVAVFDPATIQDRATYDNPHQYATGMAHVFVNGQQVVKDGVHTGAKPGRVVRGPGYKR